jgi:cysteine desulfurase/selenocysteine lyase
VTLTSVSTGGGNVAARTSGDATKNVNVVSVNSLGGSVSFTLEGIHPHDLGQFLDSQGIAVRTGHHCAWPLNRKMGVQSTTRASLYLYNTDDDIRALATGIADAQRYFG